MSAGHRTRKIAIIAGGSALVAMGAMTACSTTTEKEAPTSTVSSTAPSSTSPALSPTEKVITPGGDNSFSPTVNPAPPGAVCRDIVNGVCVR